VSVVGVVVAGRLVGDNFAANTESVRAFHQVVVICAVLVAAGGVAGALGIVNPRRTVEAERCPGGQLVGAPQPAVDPTPVASRAVVNPGTAGGVMDDPQIHQTIEQLVAEEHELWQRESAEQATEADRTRYPDTASFRPAEVVERYEQ
jgi:hypothetical protein